MSFYRAIRPAVTVDCLFFRVYFSAYFHVSNAFTLYVISVPSPSLGTLPFVFDPSCRPSASRSVDSELRKRGLRNGGQKVRDRDCRRESGRTRPAAIPRYTNLLVKLAKLARGFRNSKMARIRIAD